VCTLHACARVLVGWLVGGAAAAAAAADALRQLTLLLRVATRLRRRRQEALKQEVLQVWPPHGRFTPGDLKAGNGGESLAQTLETRGWPAVNTLKGKALLQLNLYGDCSPGRAVADHDFFWVRLGDPGTAQEDCAYSEGGGVAPYVMRRTGVLTGGCLLTRMGKDPEDERQAAPQLQAALASGVRLVASDYPHLFGSPSVGEVAQVP